ncbi:unnamed protein product [Sphenostylis stenocarpa]|uniref:Uncharacterized protein n=1 Tax=Sphenostylis stenocarpa TaxID=92480 RepID=A0AA86V9P2_9FABA|nr:unnamed protein product [Sphenostylis stenocarpa]
MHKFKFLATQCAVAGSPTRSPTTSPVIHLRRRKTLRMFLARRRFHPPAQDPPPLPDSSEARVRHKLKDLFVSSPPPPLNDDKTIFHQQQQQRQRKEEEDQRDELIPSPSVGLRLRTGSPFRRSAAALRPVSSVFRYRLLRRAWRPVLVTIPE